jgi:flagellar motor switch protein FliM
MPEGSEPSVLRQKLARARPPLNDGSPSIEKGLKLALSKVAEVQHDMILAATPADPFSCDLAKLQSLAKDDDLLFCLRTGDGDIGLVMVDLQTRAALIEVQTTGAVTSRAAVDRPVTRTDAKLVEPTLKALMEEFDNIFVPHKNRHWALGYRPSLMLEGPRLIGLVLEDVRYKVYSVDLDIAMGAKKGVLRFAFLQDRGVGETEQPLAAQSTFGERLNDALDDAKIELGAVLDRFKIPLSQAKSLKVGDVFLISADAPQQVKIVGSHGKDVAQGELGLNRGHLAVRIQSEGATKLHPKQKKLNPDHTKDAEAKSNAPSMQKSAVPDEPITRVEDLPDLPAMDLSDDFADLPSLDDTSAPEDFEFPALEDLPELTG